jgi:GPI mannosyltransferase 2
MAYRDAVTCVVTVTMVLSPFVAHHYNAWISFCLDLSQSTPTWCSQRLPLIYGYIQSKYWSVGFLRYWTPAQIPNFILCLPIILVLSWSSSTLLMHQWRSLFEKILTQKSQGFYNPDLLPHAIHAAIFTTWITLAAHVQILLRLAPSMPFLYWSATRLIVEHPRIGKYWIYWSVVWGAASTVLWAAFLPPA